MDLQKAVDDVLNAVGGEDNITSAEHCATRLRIMVSDESKVDKEALKNLESAKGYIYQAGQHQIIFGTGLVVKVYNAFKDSLNKELKSIDKKDVYDKLNPLQKISRIFGDIFIPIIPAIVVTGLFMGIRGFVSSMGVEINAEVNVVLGILTDTAFVFLPVFVVWSAFQKFGGSPILGILSGLMLVSPSLPNAWAVAFGSAEPMIISIFGIEFGLVGYQGAIITPLILAWLACWVEKQARKFIPDFLALLGVPLIVISFVTVVGVVLLSPILHTFEYAIGAMFQNFVGLPFGIGGLIIGFFQEALVVTGLHHVLSTVELALLNSLGYNALNGIITAAMGGMAGAAFSIAFRKPKGKERTDAISLILPVFFGITEPMLFGLTLVNPKVFLAGMIAGGVAGFAAGLIQLQALGLALTFVPGLSLYFGTKFMLWYIFIMALSLALGFIFGNIAIRLNNNKIS